MADHQGKHYFTVTHGTFSRSNKDGSLTTFMKGETVELENPAQAQNVANLVPTPEGGRLPSPDGFLPKTPERDSTTVDAARARAQQDKAATTAMAAGKPAPNLAVDRTVPRPAKGETVVVADPHRVSEKPSEKG